MTEDEKMAAFGRMVFELMTDILILPEGEAYARKAVTMPDGKGGKHRLELIVARKGVADAMEEAAAARFNVTDVKPETEGRKQ
jgi:hypothetical protein